MQRRKFVSLILSGILAPEYLLKGRSMISVPQFNTMNINFNEFTHVTSHGYNLRYAILMPSTSQFSTNYQLEYRKIGELDWYKVI